MSMRMRGRKVNSRVGVTRPVSMKQKKTPYTSRAVFFRMWVATVVAGGVT